MRMESASVKGQRGNRRGGLTNAKARKLAEAEAYRWEQELRCGEGSAFQQGQFSPPHSASCEAVQTVEEVPEEETFRYFVEQVWMPLKVISGGARPSTIAMYRFMMRVSLPVLGAKRLKDITAVDIMRYLQYLREEYRAPDGRTLSEKSIKHNYDILRIIFNYAEKQEAIEKNPIKKVDAPKTVKRPVEALSQEQAKIFFRALNGCKLEYRCTIRAYLCDAAVGEWRRHQERPRDIGSRGCLHHAEFLCKVRPATNEGCHAALCGCVQSVNCCAVEAQRNARSFILRAFFRVP